jgi:hypothetical protein
MKPQLRPHPSGGAVEAVARGGADLVVIGVSTIRSEPAVTLVGWLPPELQNYIVFTGCPCRKRKLEHIDGVARPRSATNARALFGTHHAEPARPSAAIGAF